MIIIRSFLFNIFFYSFTALCCVFFIPFVFMPRKFVLWAIDLYFKGVYIIEKYILGLDFEIRGKKYLPTNTNYIVAAKHQSAYETLKLHYLFGDPTIILKKELLDIPLFGRFLKKIDVIAINRSNREESIQSIIDGAKRMEKTDRPIVIFPQGTRVSVQSNTDEKPYKGGIIKMYANTSLPIIPLALNSGMFWARNSFVKKPGKVIFEFLPLIEPGLPDKQVLKTLENIIEEKSVALMHEAKNQFPYLETPPPLLTFKDTTS